MSTCIALYALFLLLEPGFVVTWSWQNVLIVVRNFKIYSTKGLAQLNVQLTLHNNACEK